MEFDLITEPIQKSVNYAIELINQINEENPREIIFELQQINFSLNETLKTFDIKFFISNYKTLFERNLNAIRNVFVAKDTLDGVFNSAKKINNDLNTLNKRIEKIQLNFFEKGFKGIKEKMMLIELKKAISKDLTQYNEEKDKFMKEFKRRNMEILSITNTYLYLLIKLIKNIKKLSETLKTGFETFNKSESYFQQQTSINSGKYLIVESYRQIALLVGEINNIFIITEKTAKRKSEQFLNKLKDLDQNLKRHYKDIYTKINDYREKQNYPKVNPDNLNLGLEEMIIINEDCSQLEIEMNQIYESIKLNYIDIYSLENEFRLDILFILDTTSSMGYFIDKFKFQFLQIIQEIRKEIPEAILFTGFIGYKDIFDKELGDEYIVYDFTTNYEILKSKIEEIEPDGGVDIPEDIPGAFELAFDKIDQSWKGNTKIAILMTDSPCHGTEFHNLNQNNDEQRDEYPKGDPEGRDIKEMIRKFVKYKISLFCVELGKKTEKMYKIFGKEYERLLQPMAINKFFIVKDSFNYKFVEKIKDIFYSFLEILKLKHKEKEKKKNNKNKNHIEDNNEQIMGSENRLKLNN